MIPANLVTMANHPANIYLLILDSGMYEVTGGQPTAGTGHTDFAGLARAAGIRRVYAFDTVEAWRAGAAEALSGTGPVVVWLKIEGRMGQKMPNAPRAMGEQIVRLKEAMRSENATDDWTTFRKGRHVDPAGHLG